ncbi:MAG: DUF6383 domain-containing protein [Paludibacter sp.]
MDSAKAILPVIPVVKGTYTYTSGAYGSTSNWLASVPGTTTLATSLYQGTAATNLPQGSILNTGSAYYYVPVVRSTSTYMTDNPITLAGDTIMKYIVAGQYASGSSINNVLVNTVSGNSVTLASAPTATSTQTNATVQFFGIQGTVAPTGTSSDTNNPLFDGAQALIYLGGVEFATPVIAPNAVNSPNKNNVLVYSDQKNSIAISNATAGDIATVYSVSGIKVASAKLTSDKASFTIPTGIYIVKINDSVAKIAVK